MYGVDVQITGPWLRPNRAAEVTIPTGLGLGPAELVDPYFQALRREEYTVLAINIAHMVLGRGSGLEIAGSWYSVHASTIPH